MTNAVVKLTPDVKERIMKMDDAALARYAQKQAASILHRVRELSEVIDKAKEDSEKAKGVETGFFNFGNTKKKVNLTADALVQTNEAMKNIAEIQREAILFTCVSARFAHAMCEAMSLMLANGLKDSNGNLHELDQNTQAFAQHILSTADDFARKQLQNEVWQNQQDEELERQRRKDDEHDRRLEDLGSRIEVMEKNEAHQSEQDEELERQRGKDKEHDLELERQRKKDDEHDCKLSSLEQRIKAMEASAVPAWIKVLLVVQTIAIVWLLVKAFSR